MGFLSRFENKVEDTFEGAADRISNSPISPVQIAKKAEKQMRREKMVGAGKQYAPTLYTVLVNPEDDERMFGYYPTLAGEIETFLTAKANEEGLIMDGQPLVRFFVDDGLRHGKFDVIAEAVAAPLIAQLREEEMERYGIATPKPQVRSHGFAGAGAGSANAPAGYGAQAMPAAGRGAAGAAGFAAAGAAGMAGAPAGYGTQAQAYPQEAQDDYYQEPLPDVPENEIDYSADYGEYTFDSRDFASYEDEYAQESAQDFQDEPVAPEQPMANNAFAGIDTFAEDAAAVAAAEAPNTVVFAGGAGQAAPLAGAAPTDIIPMSLIDINTNRTYRLASARLLVGRESSCDIVLHDINASRTHAELTFDTQNNLWIITDLGSTNGTFVNGREITSEALYPSDRITIGTTNLVFANA